jgi:hypothetical protein
MSQTRTYTPSIQRLFIAGTFGLIAACGGQGSPTHLDTNSLLVTPQSADNLKLADTVACTSSASDPDGDGWGWENGGSCLIVDTPTQQSEVTASTPVVEVASNPVDPRNCTEITADPDGDGWGWENHNPCIADSQPVTDNGANLPVGILYFLWHCQATSLNQQHNISEILNGQSDWGAKGTFHWWDRPEEGYYCLGDQRDLIYRHLTMLRDAGIDFLVLDITNHPNTASFAAETFILKSLRPVLEVARTIPGAPKFVPWVPFTDDNSGTINERNSICNNGNAARCRELQRAEPMYQHVTDLLSNEFPELVFEYDGKPLLLEAAADDRYPREETDQIRPALQANWTVERMWGLRLHNEEWQFISTCGNALDFYQSNGWTEAGCNQPVNAGKQISVAAAYQYTYISEPFTQTPNSYAGFTGGMPKFFGRTMAQQFRVAFENRDVEPLVILTGWNEWIAQRFDFNGNPTFVDLYDDHLNRDIEPGGESGDLYYYLMRDLIQQYRNAKPFSFEDYFLTKESILDTTFYRDSYADLQATFASDDESGLLNHWLTVGMYEGRRPSVAYDPAYYRNSYSDLAGAGIVSHEALLNHFLDFGFQEGRQGSADFHAPSYLERYAAVADVYGDNGYYKSFKHFVKFGQGQNAKP